VAGTVAAAVDAGVFVLGREKAELLANGDKSDRKI
jgi:hypothetical protein